jgi:hypothetical protein
VAETKRKPRVYVEDNCTYVIGTEDMHEACRVLEINPNTHRWGSTDSGLYVRRQGRWRAASELYTPKDARPGVCFRGRIRPTTLTIRKPEIHTGPRHQTVDEATVSYLREAARRVRDKRYWGSGVTALVADLLDNTATAIEALEP